MPKISDMVHATRRNRHLKAKFDTQDFTNDVAIELLRYLPRIEARDSATLESYLRIVVRSVVCERYRQLMTKRQDVMRERPIPGDTSVSFDLPADSATSVTSQVSKFEEAARIRALLPLLGPLDEELFLRVKMLGEDTREVGKAFGQSDAWARMRARHALMKLVKLLNLSREGRLKEALDKIEREPLDEEEEGESVAAIAS